MSLPFSHLPLMPLDPAWIEQSAALVHPDPRMLPATMKLLFAAWRGAPAASIPASHAYIASATGLSPEVVAKHFLVLTEGFELREDGRLYHARLAAICERFAETYSKEIEGYATASVMAAILPDQVSLLDGAAKVSPLRGKTLRPRDFGFEKYPELRAWLTENGAAAPNQQRFLMEAFFDYDDARKEKQGDWPAHFRSWARREIGYARLPKPQWPEGHPNADRAGNASRPSSFERMSSFANGRPSRTQVVGDSNRALLDEMRQSERGG